MISKGLGILKAVTILYVIRQHLDAVDDTSMKEVMCYAYVLLL